MPTNPEAASIEAPFGSTPTSEETQEVLQGGKYFIETWGCQMNELDTQRIAGQLHRDGFAPTKQVEDADVILLNSCSVREKAQNKAYTRLGMYRLLKEDKPELKIGFCGCVAQQEGEDALRKVHDLDFVLGTGRVGEFSKVLHQVRSTGERIVATGFPDDREYDLDSISRDGQYKGMVTIVEGCNKRCTFCIVPTTRGPERSRTMAEILAEVRSLVARGFVEIELLGQTVNHWVEPELEGPRPSGSLATSSAGEFAAGSSSGADFADLLDAVARVPGVRRLRFVTSYPRDFTQRMVDQFARHANISSYLHLPVQSGSNPVLKRMGRGYEIEPYFSLIDSLREARPGLALSTDLIVGFPGETDEDFEATLALVRKIRYSTIYAFKYSPRPNTPALRLKDEPVPLNVADARLQELFRVQGEIQKEYNDALVGTGVEALVTAPSRQKGYFSGRTDCHRVVHFPAEDGDSRVALGKIVPVTVTKANAHSLMGRISA